MSETRMDHRPYLQASVEQSLGGLTLDLKLELTEPWTVLFGPSGAGKTSLLRFLAGLSAPDARILSPGGSHDARRAGIRSGFIFFRGRTLMDFSRGVWLRPARRGIGFVTQRPALFPHMTAAENVAFGLTGRSVGERRELVGEMLNLFAAGALADRRPAALSGGERQRVALARALAPEPKLLLLDEPFTGLDVSLKDAILSNLTQWLKRHDTPALYVTHDVAEVFQTGAEVIVLRHGGIEAQGPPERVLAGERQRLLRLLGETSTGSYATHTGSISR